MRLITLTRFVAMVSAGLLAGIFLGHRMGATFALPTLPASSFVQFQQVVHVHYVQFMPVLQIAATFGSLIWLFLIRGRPRTAEFALLTVCAVGAIVVFAVTMIVNVPINNELMTWSVLSPPENLLEIWRPWDDVNTFRTIVAISVFCLEILALSMTMSDGPT